MKASLLSFFRTNPSTVTINGYDAQEFNVLKNKKLVDLVEGELDYNGEKYFRIGTKWYKTNIDYQNKLEQDFKKIDQIESTYLKPWDHSNSGDVDEGTYIKDNTSTEKIVAHTKKVQNIEIADLNDSKNKYLVHIKKGRGAYLRNLFAQEYVSASLLQGDSVFRKETLEKFSLDLTNEYEVVFAIYPEGETDLNKIFTLFAKADLLERYTSLKELGFNLKYLVIPRK